MVEIFNDFMSVLIGVGVLLALGIVFEKQLIALEDKFDIWFEGVKKNVCKQKKVKGSR